MHWSAHEYEQVRWFYAQYDHQKAADPLFQWWQQQLQTNSWTVLEIPTGRLKQRAPFKIKQTRISLSWDCSRGRAPHPPPPPRHPPHFKTSRAPRTTPTLRPHLVSCLGNACARVCRADESWRGCRKLGVKVLIPARRTVRLRTDLQSEGLEMSTVKMSSPLLLLLALLLYCEWILFYCVIFLWILLSKSNCDKLNVCAATWFLGQETMLEMKKHI